MHIYDISMPLGDRTPGWPGKTQLTLTQASAFASGRRCRSCTMSMDIHLGTHLDAPAHFIPGGRTVDQVPLSLMAGPCKVIEYRGCPGAEIPVEVMTGRRADRVLFKTRNSELLSRLVFDSTFVALSAPLAQALVEAGTRLVGIDYFSVDCFGSADYPVHRCLLAAGVVILEGLNLSLVEPGDYQLTALPLKLVGADGSPVRAILSREPT